MKKRRRQSGFTLLEAAMATALLAAAAAGILLPFTGAVNEQVQGWRQATASQLACELMEKIANTDYNLIIATYDGYNENEGAMLDIANAVHTGTAYTGFSRSATCEAVTAASVGMISVTVVVKYEGSEVTRLTTLVGNNI